MFKALAMVGVTALVAVGGEHDANAGASKPSTAVVVPSSAAPGAHVSVFDGEKCTGKTGTATSAAFAAPIRLGPLAGMTGGSGRIRTGVKPGSYSVTMSCGNVMTTTVAVARSGSSGGVGLIGAAAAGDGTSQAPASRDVMTGFVVVAAAIALSGYALRHRRFLVRSAA